MCSDRRAAADAMRRSVLDRLPQLKRGGCNLLVTGAVSQETAHRATRRLFGAPDLERTRVLVRTDDSDESDLLPAAVDSSSPAVTVIDFDFDSDDDADTTADPLSALGAAVVEAADAFGAGSRRCAGEFRLSVTSLDRLLLASDVAAVERFLRRATEAVTSVRGLGQYRYAGPRSELSALPLDLLFDAFVELRDQPGAEHRVSLSRAPPTDWVEL